MAKSVTGVHKVVYALLTEDSKTGTVYGTVKPLAPIIQISTEIATASETQYADNVAYDTDTQIGETTLNMEVPGLDSAVLRELLGLEAVNGVTVFKADAKAPYVAVGYIGTRSDDTEICKWLLKGKFNVPSDDYSSKADGVEYKTTSLDATFIPRESDKAFKVEADTADEDFVGYATFFNAPFVAPVAP
ncbi:major tail protein [Peribacillus frigoritolerans]|uniref:major tail protein n=1 Tax=Peribacillus frigoritolerans TaxID=450367 RepID=UPI002E1F7299|nr:major tail protein [Peribacillus frigoritolerans]MED4693783.1 hypothetical protein [Peribacillus frigoritolerans]